MQADMGFADWRGIRHRQMIKWANIWLTGDAVCLQLNRLQEGSWELYSFGGGGRRGTAIVTLQIHLENTCLIWPG